MNQAEEMDDLKEKLKTVTAERNQYHAAYTDLRLKTLETDRDDHEKRIRRVEDGITRFNMLMMLSTGGGLISVIVLFRTLSGL